MAASILFWILSILYGPVVIAFICVVVLASVGQSLGVRHLFTQFLLYIFEFGRQKINTSKKKRLSREEQAKYEESTVPNGESVSVIEREISLSATEGIQIENQRSLETMQREFQIEDAMYFCKSGIGAIIEDDVTQRFSTEELPSWNLLTRTNMNYRHLSVRLTVLYAVGFLFRYGFLFPFRFLLAFFGISYLIICMSLIGYLPNGRMKRTIVKLASLMCNRICTRCFSSVVRFHNPENKAKGGGICVANHTSPIDVIILSTDNCYAMVGQSQGGLIGMIQRAMGRATSHIWFERSEAKDRNLVTKRLKDHVEDKDKWPILIFPEGTCINNTSVMMFKKGSFEVGGVIYPVAIKYDPRFADAFWNSSKQSMVQYLLMIFTSWAIVCDVWYLPPEVKRDDETAVEFANRVKKDIAKQGGLVDLEWDGQLKRAKVKPAWMQKQQESYSKMIKVE
ncbi:unnamed protein product [Owenia fusiformis]|uniref:Uncharacterized protein n=1 Tax=Owenia fusiformis TaxID=6347 RepID=A0A8J1T7X5_OWEFU|nr:unnamed protein product [Owenia fusiformis]